MLLKPLHVMLQRIATPIIISCARIHVYTVTKTYFFWQKTTNTLTYMPITTLKTYMLTPPRCQKHCIR